MRRSSGIAALVVTALVRFTLQAAEPAMYAHCVDVGQANACLLEFQCGAILIDAGAQDQDHETRLVDYLKEFFQRRTDLNKTLESIIITHNHIDHTSALRKVVESFTIKRYIDNGQLEGTGTANPRWVRENATTGGRNIALKEITHAQVAGLNHKNGLSDNEIDPLSCNECDPKIVVLSGRRDEDPGWAPGEFGDKNNHSIVIRVEFGEASFLFTGDLEEPAIASLLEYYEGTPTLDVDVYHVGHHGSHNGTTEDFLEDMSPEIALISVGKWTFGRSPRLTYSTNAYGHPRRVVIDWLSSEINRFRPASVEVMVAEGVRRFEPYNLRKAIYATAWDGTIKIRASKLGKFFVTRNN